MDTPWEASSSSIAMQSEPSKVQIVQSMVRGAEEQIALITSPPELRLRSPIPEPQNNGDCGEASRSASEAIRQANQSASQSIQQASQQASQSVREANQKASQAAQQASQSASQAIQQFSNSASQSIGAASRSVSAAVQSADQAVAQAKSSADAAIARANGAMTTAQASAASVQADASMAILQAGAAVAAATGSAAAAGSSFLAAAAKATQGAQATISGISAAAASFAAQAGDQVKASQTTAVTATQAALAIVGSIIASTLITILIYFLVIRHKRSARRKSKETKSPNNEYSSDPKFPIVEQFPISDQVGTTIAASNQFVKFNEEKNGPPTNASFSLFLKITESSPNRGAVKKTTVPWDPSKPPKAPILNSWLKVRDEVSPFGTIKLPGGKTPLPLGGQLKSPLGRFPTPKSPPSPVKPFLMTPANKTPESPKRYSPRPKSSQESNIPTAIWSPKIAKLITIGNSKRIAPSKIPRSPLALTPLKPDTPPQQLMLTHHYRESKASVWTDDVVSPSPLASPPLQSPPPQQRGLGKKEPPSVTKFYNMEIPPPMNPVRNTAEWLAARRERTSIQPNQPGDNPSNKNMSNNINDIRKQLGLPGNPRLGLPTRPGPNMPQSMEGEVGCVDELNKRYASDDRG
ncbi:uncharacterized protein RCO7_09738 [Rhynchosporium graminicola]|uniref:Uncharacterized protein n=1 Tax=Rhynchosporium graminicola TaxID=2792576 RepID=A0A1E1LAA1_9HELO|nr:uncharacterized protein RCO7_09738 [Rhynchosporium commune]